MSEVCFLIQMDVERERESGCSVCLGGEGGVTAIDSRPLCIPQHRTEQSLEVNSHRLKDSHKQMYSYSVELILNRVGMSTCSCGAPQWCSNGCFPHVSGWRMEVFIIKIKAPDWMFIKWIQLNQSLLHKESEDGHCWCSYLRFLKESELESKKTRLLVFVKCNI